MKKLIIYSFMFTVLMILIQCIHNQPVIDAENTLYPLEQTVTVSELNPYVENVEIIQLEETNQSLMSELSKILIDKNGNLFTLSYSGNLIAFKSDGSFYRNIGERGRGPREYIGITDIAISENGDELMLLDATTVKCYGISDSTQYREFKTPAGVPFDAISPSKNGGAYLFTSYPAKYSDYKEQAKDFLLYCVDNKGDVIEKYIPREDCTFSIGNITQTLNNEYFLRPQDNNHIFYKLSDKIRPTYKIDFKNETIPHRYFYKEANEDIGSYMSAPYYKLPIYIYETKDILTFKSAGHNGEEVCFVYSLKEKKGIRWTNIASDPLIQILASDSNYFYAVISKLDIEKYNKSNPTAHGLFFRFVAEKVINHEKNNNCNNNNPLLVKIKFSF